MAEWLTIVSGFPRSGTSMMMQMIDRGGIPALTDNVRTADEDNPKGYYEFEAVKRLKDDSNWVTGAGGRVVKMVYRLLYDLPPNQDYRVVFMKRDFREVISSQEVMLQRAGKPSGDIPPDRLAQIYEYELRDIETWLANHPNFKVLYVNYRDVLERPDEVAGRLNEFLGGNLDVDAMAGVPDRGLYRKRA